MTKSNDDLTLVSTATPALEFAIPAAPSAAVLVAAFESELEQRVEDLNKAIERATASNVEVAISSTGKVLSVAKVKAGLDALRPVPSDVFVIVRDHLGHNPEELVVRLMLKPGADLYNALNHEIDALITGNFLPKRVTQIIHYRSVTRLQGGDFVAAGARDFRHY